MPNGQNIGHQRNKENGENKPNGAYSCRISGFGDFCADNLILLEMHRQMFFAEWERNHPI